MIKTYHGSFETKVDKYLIAGQSSTYLQRIGEFDGEGTLPKEFGLNYLSKLSYRQTSELVEDTELAVLTAYLHNQNIFSTN